MGLRLLVVEGNEREAREAHALRFGRTPAQAYADVLERLAPDARCDICLPADDGANLPQAAGLADYDGVAWTGSSLHVYQPGAAVSRQIELARAVFSARTPYFGSCWGLQVASVAAGGSVVRNPKGREAGVARNIAPTPAGRAHPLLDGRPDAFDAPCVHFDIVEALPLEAVALAANAYAPVQAAEIRHAGGVFWGVQYHPEYGLDQMAVILERGWRSLVEGGMMQDQAAVCAYGADLRALHADPGRQDIAWRLGLQPEIRDEALRLTEIANWLAHFVRKEQSRRGRA